MASSSGGAHSSNEYNASIEHDFSTGGSLSPQTNSNNLITRVQNFQTPGTNPNPEITANPVTVHQNPLQKEIGPCSASTVGSQHRTSSIAPGSHHPPIPNNFSVESSEFGRSKSPSSVFSNSFPGNNPDSTEYAASDSLKWSSLMNKYQELSSEIGYTEDMEARCEQQLASIRARKNLLREVQQETESMLNDQPQSANQTQQTSKLPKPSEGGKSSTLPHESRSTLSSPGMSTKSRSSTMSGLPPGFEGSSIPLQPKAAPVFNYSPSAVYKDPLEFLGPSNGPLFFPNMSSFLDSKSFKEGQLITVSSESSEESLDDAAALEELTPYFGVASESINVSESMDVPDSVPDSVPMTDDNQDVFEDPKSEELMQEATSDVSALMQRFLKFSEMHQNEPLTNLTIEVQEGAQRVNEEPIYPETHPKLGVDTRRPIEESKTEAASVRTNFMTKVDSQTTTTAEDHAIVSSGGDSNSDVESLKSEIYVLRTKVQKLVNYTPEHANKKAYRSKISEVQKQLRCLEEMISACSPGPRSDSNPQPPPPLGGTDGTSPAPVTCSASTTADPHISATINTAVIDHVRQSPAGEVDKDEHLQSSSSKITSTTNETSNNNNSNNSNSNHLKSKHQNSDTTSKLNSHTSKRSDDITRSFNDDAAHGNDVKMTSPHVGGADGQQKSSKKSTGSSSTSTGGGGNTSATLRKERHNYTKMVLEYIHKMRQLNIQLLKDKINRKQYYHYYNSHHAKKHSSGAAPGSEDTSGVSQTFLEEEDLLLLAEELDLHQQKVMELEQRLGNWHLWLLECSTAVEPITSSSSTSVNATTHNTPDSADNDTNNKQPDGSSQQQQSGGGGGGNSWASRWEAMKGELDLLAVESENTCTLVKIALTRHNRLRAILQQKGASITASSGSDRRRKTAASGNSRGVHHKRRGGNNSSHTNSATYEHNSGGSNSGGGVKEAESQSVWVERSDRHVTASSHTKNKEVEATSGDEIWKRTNQIAVSSATSSGVGAQSSIAAVVAPKKAGSHLIRQSSTESEITKITGRREESDSNSYGIDELGKKQHESISESIATNSQQMNQSQVANASNTSSANLLSSSDPSQAMDPKMMQKQTRQQQMMEHQYSTQTTYDLARGSQFLTGDRRLFRNQTVTNVPLNHHPGLQQQQQLPTQPYYVSQIMSPNRQHQIVIQGQSYTAVYPPQQVISFENRGRSYTTVPYASRVKEQPTGLVVLERAKSVEASDRRRFSRGASQDESGTQTEPPNQFEEAPEPRRISKTQRSRSTISLPAHPAKLHETSFIESSPKTVNLLDHSYNGPSSLTHSMLRGSRMQPSESRDSLFSVPPRLPQQAPQSPFAQKRFQGSETNPRATPIFLDGGNIFSTKSGGVYRIKQPVNDLQGNDRRSATRRMLAATPAHHYQSGGGGGTGYDPGTVSDSGGITDTDGPGTKSDSELVAMTKSQAKTPPVQIYQPAATPGPYQAIAAVPIMQQQQLHMMTTPHKQKKKKGLTGAGHAFKNKLHKFTKDLEAHLLPEIADANRANSEMQQLQMAAGIPQQQIIQQGYGPPQIIQTAQMTPMLAEFYDSRRQLQAVSNAQIQQQQQQLMSSGNVPQVASQIASSQAQIASQQNAVGQFVYAQQPTMVANSNIQPVIKTPQGQLVSIPSQVIVVDQGSRSTAQSPARTTVPPQQQQVIATSGTTANPVVQATSTGNIPNIQLPNGDPTCSSPNQIRSPADSVLSPSSSLSGNNKLDAQMSPRHSGGSSMGSLAAAAGANTSAGSNPGNQSMGSKICATPCYYRTMPGNKIQVIYPDSNRIFQYTYSRTLPPPNKKSSTQIIQQVQPDGTLSEEKLYFFDPIQLTDAQNEQVMAQQITVDDSNIQTKQQQQQPAGMSTHQRSVSLGRSKSDGSNLEHLGREKMMMRGQTPQGVHFAYPDQYPYSRDVAEGGWLNRKKHTVKGLVRLTKELIK